jgi:predicted nucleic acid-binding protein
MAAENLPKVPAGTDIFLDANVLIYGLGGHSLECVGLLRRCASEQLTGITSYAVVGEVTHRLMLEEAISKGLAGAQPRKTLNQHPERVRQLTDYWLEVERLLTLNLLILTVDEDTIRVAQKERERFGLLNNDSLITASMRLYGIRAIATHDHSFERCTDLSVFSPTDI